jgi:hypothetical protein
MAAFSLRSASIMNGQRPEWGALIAHLQAVIHAPIED